jgi:hypothetical protein
MSNSVYIFGIETSDAVVIGEYNQFCSDFSVWANHGTERDMIFKDMYMKIEVERARQKDQQFLRHLAEYINSAAGKVELETRLESMMPVESQRRAIT